MRLLPGELAAGRLGRQLPAARGAKGALRSWRRLHRAAWLAQSLERSPPPVGIGGGWVRSECAPKQEVLGYANASSTRICDRERL